MMIKKLTTLFALLAILIPSSAYALQPTSSGGSSGSSTSTSSSSSSGSTSGSGNYDPLGGACNSSPNVKNSPVCQQYFKQQNDQNNTNPIVGGSCMTSTSCGLLQTVTNVMALLTGIVAVAMIIASGITFITAGGAPGGQRAGDNPTKAKKARAQLIAAVIGLVIVAFSWTILTFIIQKFVQ